jgi:hypothetical protein
VIRVLHVARGDMRRWGWLALLVVLLGIGDRFLADVAPMEALHQPSMASALDALVLLLALAQVLATLVLVAAVVHETPIVGTRAFWMTRPIALRAIVGAKALTLGLTLIVVPVAIDAAILVWRGLPLGLVLLDASEGLAGIRLVALLVLLLAAALTSSVVSYLVTLVASLIGYVIVALAITAIAPPAPTIEFGEAPFIVDPWPMFQAWVGALLTVVTPLAVLIATRRRAVAIAVLAILVAPLPIPQWPPVPDLLRRATPDTPAWANADHTLRLSLGSSAAHLGSFVPQAILAARRVAPPKPVLVELYVANRPSGYYAEPAEIRSRFIMSDGATIEARGRPLRQTLPGGPLDRPQPRYDAWQAAVGWDARSRSVRTQPAGFPTPTAIAAIEGRDQAARLTRGPVRYDGEVVFDLWAHRLVAVVPGNARARIDDGGRVIEIVALDRRSEMISLLVRQTMIASLLQPAIIPTYHLALKEPGQPTILTGNDSRVHGTLDTALMRVPLAGWRFGFPGADPRPRTEWRVVQFHLTTGTTVDLSWLDRAEIAVVSMRYAGRATRSVHADGLTVREPPPDAVPRRAPPGPHAPAMD